MDSRFASIGQWHRLFDALCLEQGHLDNNGLASAFCALSKNKSNGAYESTLKNLNNWRQGVHTPNRRNFRLLTLLLRLEEGDAVLPHWRRLYEEAQRRKPAAGPKRDREVLGEPLPSSFPSLLPPSPPFPVPSPLSSTSPAPAAAALFRRRAGWGRAVAAALVLAAASGVLLWLIGPPDSEAERALGNRPTPGDPVLDMTDRQIYWRELAELAVGQSAVIHGKRGRCGEPPPSWAETFEDLPGLSTGRWSDGGVGYRVSRSCGGPTPARAVVFTATQPGEDRFILYEDPITLRVTE